MWVHIDSERFRKPIVFEKRFLWISTFDSVLENLRFVGMFVWISVDLFTKTELFPSGFVQKQSSMRVLDMKLQCVNVEKIPKLKVTGIASNRLCFIFLQLLPWIMESCNLPRSIQRFPCRDTRNSC